MRLKAETHCICGAYRMAQRDTLDDAEQVVRDWYAEHLEEYPELEYAKTNNATANQAREYFRMM